MHLTQEYMKHNGTILYEIWGFHCNEHTDWGLQGYYNLQSLSSSATRLPRLQSDKLSENVVRSLNSSWAIHCGHLSRLVISIPGIKSEFLTQQMQCLYHNLGTDFSVPCCGNWIISGEDTIKQDYITQLTYSIHSPNCMLQGTAKYTTLTQTVQPRQMKTACNSKCSKARNVVPLTYSHMVKWRVKSSMALKHTIW